MKKNKGFFGGVLEFGGNVIGKAMDAALSITDKISRGLLGDKITDAVEKPFNMAKDAGRITAGKIGELSEKLEQEAAKYEKATKTDMHYLPDNPASNIAKGKANTPLTNDIGNLINSKTAGSSALAGPAGNLA